MLKFETRREKKRKQLLSRKKNKEKKRSNYRNISKKLSSAIS